MIDYLDKLYVVPRPFPAIITQTFMKEDTSDI